MIKTRTLSFILLICFAGAAYAGTLDDIRTNVVNNYNAVEDFSAVLDVSQSHYEGIVDGDYKDAGFDCFRFDGTGSDVRKIRSNGTTVWHDYDGSGWNSTSYSAWRADRDTHYKNDSSMFDFASVINDNTWTLVDGIFSVSGVQCYKITSSNYDMWVDVATKTKTFKIVNKNETNEYAVLTGWSVIESTAYIASTVNYYYNYDSKTTTFSSISINDNLPSSTWEVQ